MDQGIAIVVAALISAAISWPGGMRFGGRGKKKGFAKLVTELDLNKTQWRSDFVDNAEGSSQAYFDLRQHGSRVTGEAESADKKRRWVIEGVVYKGRLCYLYVDADPHNLSLGAAVLKNRGDGVLEGKWLGWGPDGENLDPRDVTLTNVS